jgi:hypothetical protein
MSQSINKTLILGQMLGKVLVENAKKMWKESVDKIVGIILSVESVLFLQFFFFLGDYTASCLKFKPTFRDHYLSCHQGCN